MKYIEGTNTPTLKSDQYRDQSVRPLAINIDPTIVPTTLNSVAMAKRRRALRAGSLPSKYSISGANTKTPASKGPMLINRLCTDCIYPLRSNASSF